jgi:carbohydrate-selective porin OprB
LDPDILHHYGDQAELERSHSVGAQPGKLRLLAFRNRVKMSRFEDALDLAAQSGGPPDINRVRNTEHVKYGFGVNLEQNISAGVGTFVRASWADGRTETYAFMEVDRSVSGGLVFNGALWARPEDHLGIAVVCNMLSADRRRYLQAGGLGFFIGDGALRYRPETILEAYYSWAVGQHLWLTLDAHLIANPAYNADRGPVSVGSLRLHLEF